MLHGCGLFRARSGNFLKPPPFPMLRSLPSRLRPLFLPFLSLLLLSVLASAAAPQRWVGTWSTAPLRFKESEWPKDLAPENVSIRQHVKISVGGKQLRIVLTNEYGDGPLLLSSVRVGLKSSQEGEERVFLFSGEKQVWIPSGGVMVSDALNWEVPTLAELRLTLDVKKRPHVVSGHQGSRTTSYFTNLAGEQAGAAPAAIDHWFFIRNLEVLNEEGSAVVCLGDSLTDGRGSTTNGNDRWPDALSLRLAGKDETRNLGVLNLGIGANLLAGPGNGDCALGRFDRDVLSQTGARWLVIHEGVNDLGGLTKAPVAAAETRARMVIVAYQQLILRAHAKGLKVAGSTILPVGGSIYQGETVEKARQLVNRWVREAGAFDAVFDFDAALRDPSDPTRLLETYDSGDHLHLNPAGYKRMAETVDVAFFAQDAAAACSKN